MKVDMSPAGITARLHEMDDLWVLSGMLMNACKGIPRTKRRVATRGLEIYDSIRQVLLRDWDPIGIRDNGELSDEYDAYIAPVYRVLVGSRSRDELIGCLQRMEEEEIGVGPAEVEGLGSVAEKLLSLDVTFGASGDDAL
jgi:hypothetical protein